MAEPTPIQCRVVQITGGLWLNGIASVDDAQSLLNFFRDQGLPALIGAEGILLMGLTMESFLGLVDGANIELI